MKPSEWKVTKIEPEWMLGYANSPGIRLTIEGYEYKQADWIYNPVPYESRENVMLISTNNVPWVRFVFIADPNGNPSNHGALGGEYHLLDGSVFKTRTGWSSREGVINRDYRRYIDDELVGVTLDLGNHRLMAGYAIYQTYLKTHPLWPSDLHLVREEKYSGGEPYWHISTDPNEVVKPDANG